MTITTTDKMLVLPTKEFVDKLNEMTENNDHGGVYYETAKWCYMNCDSINDVEGVWIHNAKPCDYFRRVFKMFMDIFGAMNYFRDGSDSFPFGDIRYESGKKMDEVIIEAFGKRTLDALNGH